MSEHKESEVLFGDSRIPERVWKKLKVDPNTDCWLWTASTKGGGYGQVHYARHTRSVHSLIFEFLVGPIPADLDLDHLCRIRLCANPKHLEPVTRKENLSRGINLVWMKRRTVTHCPSGHAYAGDNLSHDGRGRRCKSCKNRQNREYKQRKMTQ